MAGEISTDNIPLKRTSGLPPIGMYRLMVAKTERLWSALAETFAGLKA